MTIRFGSEIAAAAANHHLDPRLLAAVAAQETGGPGSNSGRNIVGDGGHGHGVFQIDDRFWAFARTAAAMDPAKNAEMAAKILGANLQRFGGNVHRALSAYNAGSPDASGTHTRWGDGRVLGYADSVLRHYQSLGEPAGQVAADARGSMAAVDPLHGAAANAGTNRPIFHALSSVGSGSNSASSISRALLDALMSRVASRQSAPALMPAPAPTPLRSWAQLNEPGAQETADADRAVAEIIDSGDVFGVNDDGAEAS